MRIRGIYDADERSEYRCSHQNPYIKRIYEEFLGEPGSRKAHELLHTSYAARDLYLK
jgi:iron only hydrogenase large subunit-like protein